MVIQKKTSRLQFPTLVTSVCVLLPFFFYAKSASALAYDMKSFTHQQSTGSMKCYILDSFAAEPGTGNPAAVVLLPQDTDPKVMSSWMQKVAAEFNLSETAFCWPRSLDSESPSSSGGETHWNIRYFTPTIEVALCGHATLASAAVLYQGMEIQDSTKRKIVFHALDDILTMELVESSNEDSRRTDIAMEFPNSSCQDITNEDDQMTIKSMLKSAFACDDDPLYMGLSDLGDVLIELSPKSFDGIGYDKLNYQALNEWEGYTRGIIVCCEAPREPSTKKVDFLSRFFAPKAGINEDPVTGSAHCTLGPHFARKLNKTMVVGNQCSKRGGIVGCRVSDDAVRLTGTAITTMSGTLWM